MKRSRTSGSLREKVEGSNLYGGEDGTERSRKVSLRAMARNQARRENGRMVSPQTSDQEKTVLVKEMKVKKGGYPKEESLSIEVKKEENVEEVTGGAAVPVVARSDVKTAKEDTDKVVRTEAINGGGDVIFEQLENLTKSTVRPLGHWGQWNVENELVWREWINPSYVEMGHDEPAWLGDPVVIDNVKADVLPDEERDVPPVVAAPCKEEP